MIIKFSILFSFITENLTGLKESTGSHDTRAVLLNQEIIPIHLALGMQNLNFKLQKTPRLMVPQLELPVSRSTDN